MLIKKYVLCEKNMFYVNTTIKLRGKQIEQNSRMEVQSPSYVLDRDSIRLDCSIS